MKSSTIYFFEDKFYIHADCKTTVGVWVLCPPIYEASKDNLEELGRSVLGALQASKDNVTHPVDFKVLSTPLLSSAQVKSWNAFAKKALCLNIEEIDDLIILIPTKNFGQKGGYRPLVDERRIFKEISPFELGEAVLASIAVCE